MFSFPRSAARRLRTLARKCLAGRPRGPAPPVLVTPVDPGVTLSVAVEDVTVALHVPSPTQLAAPVAMPLEAFTSVEGPDDEPVEVECHKDSFTLTWADRGLPRSQSFPVVKTNDAVALPARPDKFISIPGRFLKALHEAGRTTARVPGRYALHRVQIRGRAGEVIGTDSHCVCRCECFRLPFAGEILVPAVPLFGLEEFAKAREVRIGCAAPFLTIVADDVTVFLRIDAAGTFPDVASVIPKSPAPATLTLDPADALVLLDALPALPGQEDEFRAVTLDLARRSGVVRARAETGKEVVEVHLRASAVEGGPKRIALDRRYLSRMLALGCRTFRVFTESRPLVATGDSITMLAMPVDASLIVPASAKARAFSPEHSLPNPRSSAMKTPEPAALNGSSDSDMGDPFVEAEALRNALGEAQQRLGRLLGALRSKKKEQKALSQVWSSLRNLNLGG